MTASSWRGSKSTQANIRIDPEHNRRFRENCVRRTTGDSGKFSPGNTMMGVRAARNCHNPLLSRDLSFIGIDWRVVVHVGGIFRNRMNPSPLFRCPSFPTETCRWEFRRDIRKRTRNEKRLSPKTRKQSVLSRRKSRNAVLTRAYKKFPGEIFRSGTQ